MPLPEAKDARPLKEDLVYLHSLREAKIILSIWAVCLIYSCTFCYLFGYLSHPSDSLGNGPTINAWVGPLESFNRDPSSLKTPLRLGIPDWVLYGVVVPWLICIALTFWFCLFVFHDDDLGNDDLESCDGYDGEDGELVGEPHG